MSSYQRKNAEKIGWKLNGTRHLFKSQWQNIRQDTIAIPKKEPLVYTYMEHPGSVFVVPITPSGEIILLHTHRYPVDDWKDLDL